MKNITVKNKNNIIISDQNYYEDNLIEEFKRINIQNNSWGKPERWVLKKIQILENSFIYPQETYDELDVIEEKSEELFNIFKTNDIGEFILDEFGDKIPVIQDFVKLKSEYSITITDISVLFTKENKYKEILKAYEDKMNLITSKYPTSEREGWAVKKSQAEIWLASNDSEKTNLKNSLLMLISESLSNSNEDITILANAIIRDSNAYQVFYGTETKNKRNKLKQLESAVTLTEINSIIY